MHILIIPSWYKTPEQPLSGTFFEEQARMLLAAGYKIGILYPSLKSQFSPATALKQFVSKIQPCDFIDKRIPTYYAFSKAIVPSRFQRINYWFACFTAYRKYKRYTRQYGKPNVIHGHSVFVGGIVSRYISKKQNIPYIFTEHTSSLLHSQWITTDPVSRDLVQKTFRNAQMSTFVSNSFRDDLITKFSLGAVNSVTIPNVVNPLFHSTFSKKEKSTPFILLCVAVLENNKQHKLLFDALEIILGRGYDIKLRLIGDGTNKSELMEYSREHNIQHRVDFIGAQPREIVKHEIDSAHLVVSASKFESFGLSIVEGFACGRPAVAIDSGGPRDTVNTSNGILVAENSAAKLAEAIIYVIDNYPNYNQEKIRSDSINKYSTDTIFTLVDPIYKKFA